MSIPRVYDKHWFSIIGVTPSNAGHSHPLKIVGRHTTVFMTNSKQEAMELLTQPERRRRWSVEEKLAMVRASHEPGKTVSMVARQHGVNPNQLFHWRKLYQDGGLSAVGADEQVVAA